MDAWRNDVVVLSFFPRGRSDLQTTTGEEVMQARLLKELCGSHAYCFHHTPEFVCVGSALCHDLITVCKKTGKIRYALDTFNEGRKAICDEKLKEIWDRLHSLVESMHMDSIISRNDKIENPRPVFTYDNDFEIEESHTDEYGWPNTDYQGRLMYDNQWFKTKKEAVSAAANICVLHRKYTKERYQQLKEDIEKTAQQESTLCNAEFRLTRLMQEMDKENA